MGGGHTEAVEVRLSLRGGGESLNRRYKRDETEEMDSGGEGGNRDGMAQGEEVCAPALGGTVSIRLARRSITDGGTSFWKGAGRGLVNGGSGEDGQRAGIEKLQRIIGKQAIQIEILKNGGAPGEKGEAVETFRGLGYTVKDSCEALGISRSSYSRRPMKREVGRVPEGRDEDLLGRIKTLKAEHPFWGYRRVRAWLVHREKMRVKEKRVRRVTKKNGLMGLQRGFPEGVRGQGLKLISDNGTQPTSVSFMRQMATLGIEQIFTSYDNPKGNAETERMMRTIKEEMLWLNEFSGLEEGKDKIGQWIEAEYQQVLCSFGAWISQPEEFEEDYQRQISFKEAA
jgi:hypothetical protein